MCGLWGMAGNGIFSKHLKAFRDMGIVSQLRGTDSSGVFQVDTDSYKDKNKKGILVKSATDFTYFNGLRFSKTAPKDLMDDQFCNLYIGHVRAATVGEVVEANAHPFDLGFVVGAHNGTLVDAKYQHADKTDSELMFTDANERGIETVLAELARGSAYAVSMYNRFENKMVLAHNKDRPLWIAHCKHARVMFWASEEWMLKGILARNDIEIHELYQLKTDTIVKFDPSSVKAGDSHIFEVIPVNPKYTNQSKHARNNGGNRVSTRSFPESSHDWSSYYDNWDDIDWDAPVEERQAAIETARKTDSELPLLTGLPDNLKDKDNVLLFKGQPPSGVTLPVINPPRKPISRIEYVPCISCGCLLSPVQRWYATEFVVDDEPKYECIDCKISADNGKPVTHPAEKEKVN